MRIVGSPSHLQDRARRRLTQGLGLIVAGLVLTIAGFLVTQAQGGEGPVIVSGLPVFLGIGGLVLGTSQLASAGRDRDASEGEAPVVTQLSARLNDDYTYLRRVTLPRNNVELDGILLGPHGALVLAIRALSGEYSVRGDDWFVIDPSGQEQPWSRSPTWELARPLRSLQRWAREEGLAAVPVQGAVVLVEARLRQAERPASAVVPLDRIATYVDYLRPAEPPPRHLVDQMTALLEPHAGRGLAREAPPKLS